MIPFKPIHFNVITEHPFDMFGSFEKENAAGVLINKYTAPSVDSFDEPVQMKHRHRVMEEEGWFEHVPSDDDQNWYRPTQKLLKKMWDRYGKHDQYEVRYAVLAK